MKGNKRFLESDYKCTNDNYANINTSTCITFENSELRSVVLIFFLCFVWFRIPISHQTGNLSHLVSGIVSLLLGFSTSYDLCFSFVFVSLASHFIYFKKC